MNELKELFYLIGISLDEELVPPHKEDGMDNYLNNGKRILTLARNKKQRRSLKCDNLTVRFLDLNYPKLNINRELASQQIIKCIKNTIKVYFKNVKSKEYLEKECIPFLFDNYSAFVDLEIGLPDSEYDLSLLKAVTKTNFSILVKIGNSKFYIPINPNKRFSDSSYYFKSNSRRKINICHAETMFYGLSIISLLNSLKTDAKLDKTYGSLIKQIAEEFKIAQLSEDYSYVYDDELLDVRNCIEYVLDDPVFRIPHTMEKLALYILHHIISNIQDNNEEQKHRKELEGMVARAYTTKRNIPQKILRKMEESQLNEYFGFIEFDEDVDLHLVDLITQEFMRLNKYIFHNMLCKDVSLRFRKLGRHRASGLYYPSISTMVVDLRCPSSFIHEYFHMIDDMFNDLSLEYDFSHIAMRYQYLITKYVNDSKKEGSSGVVLKGKYNLNYYLRKCEIFARCGEMYLFRNCHVVSSLLKPEENKSFCYPDDEKLNLMIEKYYGDLLSKIGENSNLRKEESYEKNIHIANH